MEDNQELTSKELTWDIKKFTENEMQIILFFGRVNLGAEVNG